MRFEGRKPSGHPKLSTKQFNIPGMVPADVLPHPKSESRSGITWMPRDRAGNKWEQFTADRGQAVVRSPWRYEPVAYEQSSPTSSARPPEWLEDRYYSEVLGYF